MQNPTHPLIHDTLQFPLDAPPDYGTVQEVAEGVLWLRIPLPFQLDHVNISPV